MDISTYIVLCPVCINPAMNQLAHGFPLKPSATQSLQTKDTLCTCEHSLKCFPQMDSLRLLAGIISCLQILHQNKNISWILSDCFLGSSEHSSEKDKNDLTTQCSPSWWSCYSCRLVFFCTAIKFSKQVFGNLSFFKLEFNSLFSLQFTSSQIMIVLTLVLTSSAPLYRIGWDLFKNSIKNPSSIFDMYQLCRYVWWPKWYHLV